MAESGGRRTPEWARHKYEVERLGFREIARLGGCSFSTVQALLVEAGATPRPRGTRIGVLGRREEMQAMRDKGATNRQIGERFGVTASSVFAALKRHARTRQAG